MSSDKHAVRICCVRRVIARDRFTTTRVYAGVSIHGSVTFLKVPVNDMCSGSDCNGGARDRPRHL